MLQWLAINALRREERFSLAVYPSSALKVPRGSIMVPILIVGGAIGAVLGFRRSRIVALAPVILLVAAIATAKWMSSAHYSWVVIGIVAVTIVPQICYVVGGYLATRVVIRSPDAVRASQLAIGNELQNVYAAPRDLPFNLAMLLEQLSEQQSHAATEWPAHA